MKGLSTFSLRLLTLLFVAICVNGAVAPAATDPVTLTLVLSGLTRPLYVTSAHIAEYRAFADPVATAASEVVLLLIPQPFAKHNATLFAVGQ